MYNKLIQGKPGKRAALDAVKMQRLTELGFAFRPRGSYLTWEDQMEKLSRFKNQHGHCKVPVSDEELGNFVKLARREYKLKHQGKKSSMTEDRERDLRNLGFVFEGGKTPQRSEPGRKTWEERFEELLAFKEEHGHTVVPQNSGRLGNWVHCKSMNSRRILDIFASSITYTYWLKCIYSSTCQLQEV
jgi:sugar phosphate isomerase/epimerase